MEDQHIANLALQCANNLLFRSLNSEYFYNIINENDFVNFILMLI